MNKNRSLTQYLDEVVMENPKIVGLVLHQVRHLRDLSKNLTYPNLLLDVCTERNDYSDGAPNKQDVGLFDSMKSM